MNDDELRRTYSALEAERGRSAVTPTVPLETVAALAAGEYHGPDRLDLLDRILADPDMARELGFLREVSQSRPDLPAVRHFPTWLPLAAAVFLVAGGGAVWQLTRPTDEPLRGDGAGFLVRVPQASSPIGAGSRLIWSANPESRGYQVEVTDPDGNAVWSSLTTDTMATVPDSITVAPGKRYLLRVTATQIDGTRREAPAVEVVGR